MKRISISYIALLALSVFLPGCIKEDLADCNFHIAVEFAEQGNCQTSPLYATPGSITVFAFNEAGVFVAQFTDDHAVFGPAYQLPLSLPQGNYTLVAWTGYTDAQFKTQNLVKGSSSLTELYMLSYNLRNGNKIAMYQPLYTGTVKQVSAINGVTQSIQLKATAKPLEISFSGLPLNHTYQARISYNAVQYKFENSLLSLWADDHYTMAGFSADADTPNNYTAQTSLLWPMGNNNPKLTVRDLTTGTDIFSTDVKGMMTQLTQVDMDCEASIKMELTLDQINPIQVGVMINGWKVQYINNEI